MADPDKPFGEKHPKRKRPGSAKDEPPAPPSGGWPPGSPEATEITYEYALAELEKANIKLRADLHKLRTDHRELRRDNGWLRTEYKKLKAEADYAWRLAHEDEKTGLDNTRAFNTKMREEIERIGKPIPKGKEKTDEITVVFLDTNDFKLINTHLGNEVGDIAIKSVGAYFQDFLEQELKPDDFIARKGGDEFVIVMHCDRDTAKKHMKDIQGHFEKQATAHFLTGYEAAPFRKGDLADVQEGASEKHKNPDLRKKPFKLSFSFGTRAVTHEECADLDLKDDQKVEFKIMEIISDADQNMRAEKDAHKHRMSTYKADTSPDSTPGRA